MIKKIALAVGCFVAALTTAASAAELRSVSRIAFGPGNVLFAADWKAGKVYAFELPPANAPGTALFNLTHLQKSLESTLGTSNFVLNDLAMRPHSDEAYLSIDSGEARMPVIVEARSNGMVRVVNVGKLQATSAALEKSGGDLTFWDKIPERAFNVTDMKWHDGKLYVAGLANQRFSSTLRILSYPFGHQALTSVEMYHTAHGQWETRAPIRALTFATINGRDTLLAAYLCAPLVSIPVAELRDGAHVRAKSLAELGVAGIPTGLLTYNQPDLSSGKTYPMLLVDERYRSALAMPLASIAREDATDGITKPVSMEALPGSNVDAQPLPFGGILRIDNQNDKYFVALRRDLSTGEAELVSFNKAADFRLSDYEVSEYLFPGYHYTPGMQDNMIKPMQNMLKREEGYPDQVRQ